MKLAKKLLSKIFLTVIILFSVENFTLAQTPKLYLITVGEYTDPGIGAGADVLKLTNFVTEVARTTVMQPIIMSLKKSELTFDILKAKITGLRCTSQDAILFVYTGHGANSDSKWPMMQLPNSDKIFLDRASEWVKGTGAGLTITLYDACNHEAGFRRNTARTSGGVGVVYAKLFKTTKGHIMACASKRGQYSLGSNVGGLFIESFIGAIVNGENKTWQAVLSKAKQETMRAAQTITKADMRGANCNDINGICQQEPYFELGTLTEGDSGHGNAPEVITSGGKQ